jgi:hypothetical protein
MQTNADDDDSSMYQPVVSDHSGRWGRAKYLFVALAVIVAFAVIGGGSLWLVSAASTTSSIWSNSVTPKTLSVSSSKAIELGLRFKSDASGQITGIRFYKGPQNTGTHTGTLWDAQGNKLAQVVFKNESNYGWQSASLSSPVAIAANVQYIVSYTAPNGHYSQSTDYLSKKYVSGHLTAMHTDNGNGPNGLYGKPGVFPKSSGAGTNYWVDVLFVTKLVSPPAVPAPPANVSATQSGATVVLGWVAAAGQNPIASYQVFRNGAPVATAGASATSWTDTSVVAGTSYAYYVKAVDNQGGVSAASNQATIKVASNPTPPPSTCPAGYTGTPPNCKPPVTPPPAAGIWKPTATAPVSWYWQLQGTVSTSPLKAKVYDIDGFDNTAATVKALHSAGATAVICYIDLGTAENFRADYSQFPASTLGNSNGWPGEKWLDISTTASLNAIKPIMKARLQMCKDKGFDAIEPDNIDSYQNKPGFSTTAAQQLTYNQWIADTAHSLGMSVGLKNDLDQIPQLVTAFDWALDEQCNQYSECDTLAPFTKANKAVFNAEYQGGTGFCTADNQARINGALFDLNLTGKYTPCKSIADTGW